MGHHQLDSLDEQILRMIAGNARIPFLEVARACNVSGAAIHQRVQKLKELSLPAVAEELSHNLNDSCTGKVNENMAKLKEKFNNSIIYYIGIVSVAFSASVIIS